MLGHTFSRHLFSGALLLAACAAPVADAESGATVGGVTTVVPTTVGPASTTSTTDPAASSTTSRTDSVSRSTTEQPATSTTAIRPAPPYEPAPGDVLTDRKQVGGRFAQAIATHGADVSAGDHADDLADRFGLELTTEFQALVAEAMEPGHEAVGSVRYAQMGGNRPTSASIMVWVDQERVTADGTRSTEGRVFDVRVRLDGPNWVVDELASAGGPEVIRPPDLPELAAAVVDHPSISMPDSARWDIYSGHTSDAMLQRMLDIADSHRYSVLVLHRGHPYHVFATAKVSRHSVGEAMDVYAVDDRLVVDSRYEGSPAWSLSRQLFDAGTGSIGSPWAFDGVGGRSFTDDVHQDHLHITSL